MAVSLFALDKGEGSQTRIPPAPYLSLPSPYCRWCGLKASGRRHDMCEFSYKVAFNIRGFGKKAVYKRDKGVSALSGRTFKIWQADHVHPLFKVDRSLPWAIVQLYWLLPNLQTLSVREHKDKTSREMKSRRASIMYVGRDPVKEGLRNGTLKMPETKDKVCLSDHV